MIDDEDYDDYDDEKVCFWLKLTRKRNKKKIKNLFLTILTNFFLPFFFSF